MGLKLMNYSIKINEIVVAKESLSLNICGEIEDSEIANGVLSKPKLILLFENEKEDRCHKEYLQRKTEEFHLFLKKFHTLGLNVYSAAFTNIGLICCFGNHEH